MSGETGEETKVKEVEVKYKLGEEKKAEMVNKLKEEGAQLVETKEERDTYYSRPDKDFMATKECLRIREREGFAELTYKPGTTREMEEAKKFWKKEVDIDITGQIEKTKELLNDLEYVKLGEVNKKRSVYKIYDVTITLDNIEGLGWFAEIEVQNEDKMYALQTLEEYAVKFSLKEEDVVDEPYRDLLLKNE